MRDEVDIIRNISTIYDSNNSLRILKDFERVLDHLNIYVFKNWEKGELVEGPEVSRHWVKCKFLWLKNDMPDPSGGKRLLDYGCLVKYTEDSLKKVRKITKPSDFRPGSKKGRIDKVPVWVVSIAMPKQLIMDVFFSTVRDAQTKKTDLEAIYNYNDTQSNAPSTMQTDMSATQETPAAPAAGGMPGGAA